MYLEIYTYSKTCVKQLLKNRQVLTKILMTTGSLMKVQSIAECSPWSILQYFWPALRNNWSWKPIFGLLESGRFTQVLLLPDFCLLTYCPRWLYFSQCSRRLVLYLASSHTLSPTLLPRVNKKILERYSSYPYVEPTLERFTTWPRTFPMVKKYALIGNIKMKYVSKKNVFLYKIKWAMLVLIACTVKSPKFKIHVTRYFILNYWLFKL